mmetsp:Transcript_16382/g.26284  ORF Transcript_16382/g.26284 Transcript_16382/m.26284 type:complete len:262 (+) Transcript_16382:567-1352(+)
MACSLFWAFQGRPSTITMSLEVIIHLSLGEDLFGLADTFIISNFCSRLCMRPYASSLSIRDSRNSSRRCSTRITICSNSNHGSSRRRCSGSSHPIEKFCPDKTSVVRFRLGSRGQGFGAAGVRVIRFRAAFLVCSLRLVVREDHTCWHGIRFLQRCRLLCPVIVFQIRRSLDLIVFRIRRNLDRIAHIAARLLAVPILLLVTPRVFSATQIPRTNLPRGGWTACSVWTARLHFSIMIKDDVQTVQLGCSITVHCQGGVGQL